MIGGGGEGSASVKHKTAILKLHTTQKGRWSINTSLISFREICIRIDKEHLLKNTNFLFTTIVPNF